MKNKVLKGIAYVVGTLWILSACAIDSESYIPFFINLICSSYLLLFSYANDWFENYTEVGYENYKGS